MPHKTNTPQQKVNCQNPTLKQKAATPHSQNTPISHHFKTIQHTFQDHQPAINQKAPQKMKSPQYLQKHAQHRLQDHQKPHTPSNQLEPIHTLHLFGNHHFYRHHQHQRDYPATQTTNNTLQDHQHPATVIQPSQDLHHPTTGLTTNIFQDHHHHHLDTTHIQPFQDQQITATTYDHTFQDHILHFHRTCTRISSQDHTNRHHHYHYQHHTSRYQDTFNKYTMFQSYYHNRYNITPYEDRRYRLNIDILL